MFVITFMHVKIKEPPIPPPAHPKSERIKSVLRKERHVVTRKGACNRHTRRTFRETTRDEFNYGRNAAILSNCSA